MTTTERLHENEQLPVKHIEPLVFCEYCGTQVPISEVYNATIFKNGDIHFLKFCCKECAASYQNGCEG